MTTANMLDTIQPALRDRMEIIEIAGYTEEEKTQIAKQHLIPKELTEHGLTPEQLHFTDEGIRAIIAGHTREAGVRSLERQIAAVCRKATREFAQAKDGDAADVQRNGGCRSRWRSISARRASSMRKPVSARASRA